jgi:hypothetical protein
MRRMAAGVESRWSIISFATLLLPMTLSEFGSASQDALLISSSLVASREVDPGTFGGTTSAATVDGAHFARAGATVSSPLFAKMGAAAGEARNAINAFAATGSLAAVAIPAENTVIFCTSGGNCPTKSAPGIGRSSRRWRDRERRPA